MKPFVRFVLLSMLFFGSNLNAQVVILPAYQAVQYKRGLTITTTAISNNTTGTSATSGGTIVGIGTVTARGVVWDTATEPTTVLVTKTNNGTGSTAFASALTTLLPVTTYYVRAYAIVAGTTIYGNEITFTTPPVSTFYTTGTLQYFTVPAGVTSITIEAVGGDGAASSSPSNTASGGGGASIKGTFTVTAGSILELLVGADGTTGTASLNSSGGGGGGSWVVRSGTLLLVAGGGGGGASSTQYGHANGGNALATNTGGSSTKGTGGTLANPVTIYTGGTSGNGGNGANSSEYGPGAGGGWFTGGQGISPGKVYPGAPSQGVVVSHSGLITGGGYGGGGGGWSSYNNAAAAGGGGGGYSGGGSSKFTWTAPTDFQGSASGGGGGSYNSGTNPVNIAGSSHSQPYIKIVW